jgi:hypothetical protein
VECGGCHDSRSEAETGEANVYEVVRPCPKRYIALKGLDILAQGNALGTTETNTSALKGRDIGYALRFGPYIPPFQG